MVADEQMIQSTRVGEGFVALSRASMAYGSSIPHLMLGDGAPMSFPATEAALAGTHREVHFLH